MTHQKVTRDVLDLKTRPINVADTPGIEIIGDCGGNFSMDGVPIGQVGECNGKFALLEATGNLDITGTGSFGGALDMNGFQINELADGVLADDAITLGQADLRYVNLSGDTMVGALTLGGAESAGADAADRDYADAAAAAAATPPGISGSYVNIGLPSGIWRWNTLTKAIFIAIVGTGGSDPYSIDIDIALDAGATPGPIVATLLKDMNVVGGNSTIEDNTVTSIVPANHWYRYTATPIGWSGPSSGISIIATYELS